MAVTVNRRDFLLYGGATAVGVTLGAAGRRWLARADERAGAWHATGAEAWSVSVCRECPAACGIRVRLMDGVPVKLEGNPLCPIARGRLCAKGQAALESYFDPDRLVGPARRAGARGENRWTRISWAEAIDEFASRLGRARADGGGILALSADEHGPIDSAWTAFWTALHGQTAWTLPPTTDRLTARFAALTGANGDPVFDLERATYVLSFGAPIVEDWLSPVWAQRSYGRFRRGAGRPRGRLVQVDGRRSMTARKADEWLAVPSDRQTALAYGIASVLLREDRVDRAALKSFGGNLAEFENAVVTQFTPDAVAVVSGVPVVTLLRLARDLAAAPQPLVVVAADAPQPLIDAVFALNALAGALDRTGGVLEAPVPADPDRGPDDAVAAIAGIVGASSPPAVLVFRDASALRSLATPVDIARDLDRCRFIVSLSPYLDETTAVADLLLPAHTPLESWHALRPPTGDGRHKLACAAPVAKPRLDTHDLVTMLHDTAARIGNDAACPFGSSAEPTQAEIAQVWRLRRGVTYATAFETNWTEQLERGGWWVPPASSSEEFAKTVLAAGGWVDPYAGAGHLRDTISRRNGLTFVPPVAAVGTGRDEHSLVDVLPASLDARIDREARKPKEWPLQLVAFTPAAVNLSGSLNQPALFELLGQPDGAPWRVWAEIDSETARSLGIQQGRNVRITSAAGAIDASAVIVDGAAPGTVAVAFVPGLGAGGRWARLVVADVRQLWGRRPRSEAVAVRVTPV